MNDEDEKRLSAMLDRAIGFVRYAETKNAAVIALSAALIAGILKYSPGNSDIGADWFLAAAVILIIASIIALESFVPVLSATRKAVSRSPHEQPNPLFFRHSASLQEEEFLAELYIDGKSERHHLELMYAQQIIKNSQIASVKFVKFERAAALVIASFILIGIGILFEFCR